MSGVYRLRIRRRLVHPANVDFDDHAAVVAYDHLCTLAREVELIWGRKLNSAVLLFHLNRWMLLIWTIVLTISQLLPLWTIPVSVSDLSGTMVAYLHVFRCTDIFRKSLKALNAECLPCFSCVRLDDLANVLLLSLSTLWAGKIKRNAQAYDES